MEKTLHEFKLKNQLVRFMVYIGAIILFFVTVSLLLYMHFAGKMSQELSRFLDSHTERIAADTNEHFAILLGAAHAIAETESTFTDSVSVQKKISNELYQTVQQYKLVSAGIALTDGTYVSTDPVKTGFISKKMYITQGLNGITSVSFELSDDKKNIWIIYAVPLIPEKEKVLGVVILKENIKELSSILMMDIPGFSASADVIDASGQVINYEKSETGVQTISKIVRSYIKKEYTEKGQNALPAGFSGLIRGSVSSVPYLVSIHPLAYDDMSIAMIIPEKSLALKTAVYIQLVHFMILISFLIFVLVFAAGMFALRNERANLYALAFRDSVTGGGTYGWFTYHVSKILKNAASNTYAMLVFDIDKFMLINDKFGYDKGNEILRGLYESQTKNIQQGELFSRLESDNFGVLVHYTDTAALISRNENVIRVLQQFNNNYLPEYILSVCEGIYVISDPHLDVVSIIDRARLALQSAKNSYGRLYRFAFYNEEDRTKIIARKNIENRAKSALDAGEFVVYLQPKVNISTNRAFHAEALIRWDDGATGLILPNEFIPIFEMNGFIYELDLYVFEKVCKTLSLWLSKGYACPVISVNLSRVYIDKENFLEDFDAIRNKYNVPAGYLEFELTESIICDHMTLLKTVVTKIHAYGYTCSIDDFGSGYSSLNILKDIPFDTIKLDKIFFVEDPSNVHKGQSVISNIIRMGKELHMQIVAEGVEEPSQLNFLKNAGCDFVQGFIYSKALSISEYELKIFQQ